MYTLLSLKKNPKYICMSIKKLIERHKEYTAWWCGGEGWEREGDGLYDEITSDAIFFFSLPVAFENFSLGSDIIHYMHKK